MRYYSISSLRILGSAIICTCALLSGCKVGPDYQKPQADVPKNWVSPAAVDEKMQADQTWWENFNDPVLNQLIAKAGSDNFDIKVAEARILQARAMRSSAKADLLPVVNTTGSAEREGNRLAFGNAPFDLTKPFNTFQAGFDASWELDLFGGKRRQVESATADLRASEASRDDIRVSMLAEVARTYIDIRQYQTQLAIISDTAKADTETLAITQQRFKAGVAPGLDTVNARAELESVEAQASRYQSLLAQAEFSMDVLLGDKPGSTSALVGVAQPIPVPAGALVLSAPAQVIADRPDIRMADQKLASATAQQGVATASFFPDISLSGFFGLLTSDSGHLLTAQSKSYDLGGSVLWPILNFNKLSASLHLADAQQQEAFLGYQKAIVVALSDVEQSLTSYEKEAEHHAALQKVGADDSAALSIARARYQQGLTNYLEVLDAERTYYNAASQLAASDALTAQDLIAVYKSLGGGWKTPVTK